MRGGPSESDLSQVLPAGLGRRCAGPVDLFKERHDRFRDGDLLRELFETVLRRCMVEDLIGGEGFAVDASMIKRAHRQCCVPATKACRPRSPAALSTRIWPFWKTRRPQRPASGVAQVHLAERSGPALDRSQQGSGLLRLCPRPRPTGRDAGPWSTCLLDAPGPGAAGRHPALSRQADRRACALKSRICPNTPMHRRDASRVSDLVRNC